MDLASLRTSSTRIRTENQQVIEDAEDKMASSAIELIERMVALATGDVSSIIEEWVPAGQAYVEVAGIRRLMFPELPPTEMVCVKRVVTKPGPNQKALEHLLNRILGKVGQAAPATGVPIDATARERPTLDDEATTDRIIELLAKRSTAGALGAAGAKQPAAVEAVGAEQAAARSA